MKKRNKSSKKIGQLFIELGLVKPKHIKEGLEYSAQWGKRLGISLVELGYMKEKDLVKGLAAFFSVKTMSLPNIRIPKNVLNCVSQLIVEKYQVLPVYFEGEKLIFATADPSNFDMIQNLEFVTGYGIEFVVAAASELRAAIDHYYLGKVRGTAPVISTADKITSKENLLNTIKGCLVENIITKDELISELIDL